MCRWERVREGEKVTRKKREFTTTLLAFQCW
jgi:hypothetical protein